MKIDEVQSRVAAAIAAVPELAAFGAAIQWSPFLDDETVKAQIATALRERGVVFEIGGISGEDNGSSPGRFAQLDVNFDVWIAENPKLTHSPMHVALVKSVVSAICAPIPRETAPKFISYQAAKDERGYVLHWLSFMVPAYIA